MQYYSNSSIKTRKWLITVFSTVFFLIFLTVYLLVLQPDLLNQDWIVAHNGVMWTGHIANQQTLDWLNNHYHLNLQADQIGTSIEVANDGAIILNINVLWVILSCIGLTVIVLLILKLTKQINYDCFTFVLTILFSFITFIFIDLIPHWNNEIVRTICTLSILFVSIASYYIGFNALFNTIMVNTNSAYSIEKEFENDDSEVLGSTEKIKKSIKHDEEEFVEV